MELTKFLGDRMAQTIYAIPLWEKLLFPLKFNRIIEIGTYTGSLSLYLYLYCINRNVEFKTFDIKPYEDSKVKEMAMLEKAFFQKNVFLLENIELIGNLIKQEGQSIIFCDGGDKIREFNIYVKYLKVGDIIGAHDWGNEIHDSDVRDVCLKYGLTHYKIDEELEGGAYSKFFIKK